MYVSYLVCLVMSIFFINIKFLPSQFDFEMVKNFETLLLETLKQNIVLTNMHHF